MLGEKRVAVVVGGSGYIGKAIASDLLQAACSVVIVTRGRHSLGELENLTSISKERISFRCADMTVETQVKRCLEEVKNTEGRIDYLIYTAGLEPDPDIPLAIYPTDSWFATLNTYVTGFFLCFREGLKRMERGGHIVAVSSAITRLPANALPPMFYAGHYAAAKAALDELCKWGRREAHEREILLSRIAPGAVDMPFHQTAPAYRKPRAMLPVHTVSKEIVEALMHAEEIDRELVANA